MENAPGKLEALVGAAGGRLLWCVQVTLMRAALLETDGVRRKHDVAALRQLQRVRLLRIAGQPGDLTLAQVKLPGVLVVGEYPGAALIRPHLPRQKQVGGYSVAGLDGVA